jgi:transposase
MFEAASNLMLRVRAALHLELAGLQKRVRQMTSNNPVCLRLMTMPAVDAVVALTYRSAIDDPSRFHSSKNVGPWVGLPPSRSHSGGRDISGGITKS